MFPIPRTRGYRRLTLLQVGEAEFFLKLKTAAKHEAPTPKDVRRPASPLQRP